MTNRLLSSPYRRGRRLARAETTEGMITMDLRFATFDLIFRDVVLRPLLVNYADRLEHGHASAGVPVSSCFVRLRWTAERSTPALAGAEVLAVEAHMPRRTGTDDDYLAFVLHRLRTTLSGGAAAGSIATRCLQMSPSTTESPFDTVFATGTFEIAHTPPRRRSLTISKLASWTGWAEVDSTDRIAPGGGTPRLN
jgi:hypothetical protein